MNLSRWIVGALLAVWVFASPAPAGLRELLVGDTLRQDWHLDHAAKEATFVGEPGADAVMELDLASLRGGALVLVIESDAEAWSLAAGQDRLSLNVKGKVKHRLSLSAAAPAPRLELDGVSPPEHKGRWIVLTTREGNRSVKLAMHGVSYANVKFEAIPEPPDPNAEPAPDEDDPAVADPGPGEDEEDGPAVPADPRERAAWVEEMTAQVRRAVVDVRVRTRDKDLYRAATGWIATSEGIMLTDWGIVGGATGAVVVLSDGKTMLEAELLGRVGFLAKLKVDLRGVPQELWHAPLPLRELPAEGSVKAWAVGWGEPVDATTVGFVSRYEMERKREDQSLWHTRMVAAHEQGYVMWADLPVYAANSGGPIVDIRGRVMGVAAWCPDPKRSSTHLSLAYAAIANELGPGPAVGWPKAPRPGDQRESLFVLPRIVSTRQVPAVEFTRLAAQVRGTHQCKVCKGAGQVEERVKVGQRASGGMVEPIYENITKACPTCDGRKYAAGPALPILLGKVSADLLAFDPASRDGVNAADAIYKALHDMLDHDPAGLSQTLNPKVIERISGTAVDPGQSVVFVGRHLGALPGGQWPRVVRVSVGDLNQAVIVTDPVLFGSHDSHPSGTILIGGVLAGTIRGGEDRPTPVVQGGFIISSEQRLPQRLTSPEGEPVER